MEEKATFAGGCFWCMEPPFRKLKGVTDVFSGYTGGHTENPTYDEVCSGSTGHAEAVEITYDPDIISYEVLLDVFWKQIDPRDMSGQFADRGSQYRTEIFYHNDEQKRIAIQSKQKIEEKIGKVKTNITQASQFYPAEEYHQDYAKKNPIRYKLYRTGSGRDRYLKKVWGKH